MELNILSKLELLLERKIYKQSFYEFYKVAFCQLHPGVDYDENWHAKYICDVLQKEAERIFRKEPREKDIIINVPFRSSKSVLTTICFPVWCWACLDPAMKFISTSYSGDLSLEHARRSRDLILSKWFQRLYGSRVKLKADVAAASHYETEKGGMRKAMGVGGQITGSGADIILCLRGDQKIMTDRGEIEIRRIVDNKLDVKALCFDHKKNTTVYRSILRFDKNNLGKKKMIKITTESGREIICTEDHEVWTENRGYILAKELNSEDIVRVVS